jgi:Holliday junction DNA helicase RuvA
MIAHLQGKLVEKTPTEVIIDCGGGYHVNISLHTYSLPKQILLNYSRICR